MYVRMSHDSSVFYEGILQVVTIILDFVMKSRVITFIYISGEWDAVALNLENFAKLNI